MPKPNEVMDVEAILAKFEDYCDCDEYHIHSPVPEYKIEANADPHDGHMEFDRDAATTAINSFVAQQNAALLRELLTHKGEAAIVIGRDGKEEVQRSGLIVIPASIVEAKLKVLEGQV